ncbi:hypothetical protein GCM10010272_29830 [Streptomyces lateritius]|nr:hypothetical protein GCM10010272_29830 [Streptomyces lateritius]
MDVPAVGVAGAVEGEALDLDRRARRAEEEAGAQGAVRAGVEKGLRLRVQVRVVHAAGPPSRRARPRRHRPGAARHGRAWAPRRGTAGTILPSSLWTTCAWDSRTPARTRART